MGRYEWEKIVKGRIMAEITDAMNHQRMTQTKSSHLPPSCQQKTHHGYSSELEPKYLILKYGRSTGMMI